MLPLLDGSAVPSFYCCREACGVIGDDRAAADSQVAVNGVAQPAALPACCVIGDDRAAADCHVAGVAQLPAAAICFAVLLATTEPPLIVVLPST